jgi:hypothetical protein
VRISRSNNRYTMFRGSVKSTGYPVHSPVSPSLPLPCVAVCHHISTGLYYNSIFAFTYMGTSLTETARIDEQLADALEGVHVFIVRGIMYLLVGILLPIAIRTPNSVHLYFFDSDMEGQVIMRCSFGTRTVHLLLFCTMTNKCTII